MDKYIGKLLDEKYEIKSILGHGGMAVVYNAEDIVNNRPVAIKILKDEFLDNEDFIRRFKNESKTIAVLSHPNIVKVYDVSFGDRIQYIVMEYIDGITLKEYIDQRKKLTWKEAVHFTVQILRALSHAHERGIVHRDIKPQNIMLLKDGTIKVTDFGIAKFSDQETRTMTDRAIGSVHYISPEQAKGEVTDEKADIYSVGVMLYEMLTGTLPFESDNAVSIAIMQLQSAPKPLRQIDPEIPEGLEEITLKAMQKNPKYRYSSTEEMLLAIDEFRKNPSIRFEYKYFVDEDPTKYVDAINMVKGSKSNSNYGDEFTMSKNKKKSKFSKSTNIAIGIGIALILFSAILITGALTNWFGFGAKDVDVPLFVGQYFRDVVENKEYKFNWNLEYSYDSSKAEGIILDQDPKAYSKKVKEDAKITLVVNNSNSKVAVPILKGKTEDAAKSELRSVGLNYEIVVVEDSETPAGVVINTDPMEGKEVTVNSTVKVFVSKGEADKKAVVPNVIGKNISEATGILASKGFKVSGNAVVEKSSKAKDTVLSTNPLPGVEVEYGATIVLTVSSGEKKDKNVSIYVDLPSSVTREVSMKTYVDGVLDSSNSKTIVPAYNTTYTLVVSGSSGTKSVVVNLDGQQYRSYEVNFDTESVKNVASYSYTSSKSNSQAPISNNTSYRATGTRANLMRTRNAR